MTSSYQIARRPHRKGTLFEAYAINGNVCPGKGFDTYFYGNHDWKFCVPNPGSCNGVNNCRGQQKGGQCSDGNRCVGTECNNWQDGSSNSFGKECMTPKSGWRIARPVLYDDRDTPDGFLYGGQIPYQMRRQLHEPRAEFDRYDYYQLPTRYAGTGYEVLKNFKKPQYALDMVDVPPVWSDRHLMNNQSYQIQQQAKQSEEEAWSTLLTNDDRGITGAFYGQPNSTKTKYEGSETLWDYNLTGQVQPIYP